MKHPKKRLRQAESIIAAQMADIEALQAEAIENAATYAAAREWRAIAEAESAERGAEVLALQATLRIVLRALGTRAEPTPTQVGKARQAIRDALDR